MTTPLDALGAALAELDRAIERCVALALTEGLDPDARQAAAGQAVSSLEMAERRVELMLAALLATGGARGLLEALGDAADRAAARLWQTVPRARAVAVSAYQQAVSREQQVIRDVAIPFWSSRLGMSI